MFAHKNLGMHDLCYCKAGTEILCKDVISIAWVRNIQLYSRFEEMLHGTKKINPFICNIM
jgi:hypothetical protein